jgi:hypothetical protein
VSDLERISEDFRALVTARGVDECSRAKARASSRASRQPISCRVVVRYAATPARKPTAQQLQVLGTINDASKLAVSC